MEDEGSGGAGGGGGGGSAGVASVVDDTPRGLRPRAVGIPGVKRTEDSAAVGGYAAAAEKRGLYNLIVPAPTTPEMIRKEKRQDNGNPKYVLVSTVRYA